MERREGDSRTEGRRRRTDVLRPQQHVASVLGGRDELLACENLVLRARLDLEQDRGREAALQLRVGSRRCCASCGRDERRACARTSRR